jgi:hypothetical protein
LLASVAPIAVPATTLLALTTIATFDFPWEYPDDALDVLVLALGVGAALRQRFLWCLVLSIVFAANRESAVFLGVIWFFLHVSRTSWLRPAIEGGIVSTCSYGITILLRLLVGPGFVANYYTPSTNVELLLGALARMNPLEYLSMTAAAVVLLVGATDFRGALVRRFFVLAAIFVACSLLFGKVNEMRVFLPSFVMLSFAVAASSQHRT